MSALTTPGPQNEALRQLFAQWPQPLLLLGEAGCVEHANEAAHRLFGAPPGALVGRRGADLLGAAPAGPAEQGSATERAVHTLDGTPRIVRVDTLACAFAGPGNMLWLLHDVTDERRDRQALLRSRDDLRRLAIGLDMVQENERRRIAWALHDELQQSLAAIAMETGGLRERLPNADADITARLDTLAQLSRDAQQATRRIVNDLRPPILEELGLEAALGALATQVSARSAMACRFEAAPGNVPVPQPVAVALYRCAEEALRNAARHAAAGEVQMQLSSRNDGTVRLRVSDDGRGMRLGEERRGSFTVGLLAMRERLRALGGQLELRSHPGAGTVIEATVRTQDARPEASAEAVAASAPEHNESVGIGSLMRFLYRTPIGLVQTSLDGQIELINPVAAQLLMPHARDGRLENLFKVLARAVPQLQQLVGEVPGSGGTVCESLRVLPTPGQAKRERPMLLSVLKQDGVRLMVVLSCADAG